MSPGKLPLIVAAIVVPIALSFLLVGPSVGLPIGALVAGALVSAAGAPAATAAAKELRSRLRADFRWIVTGRADR